MPQHLILTLNPDARYDWDCCTLRHPITADHPSLAALVADAIGETSGQFLVAVELKVTVLETVALPPPAEPCSPAVTVKGTEPLPNDYATESLPAVQTS